MRPSLRLALSLVLAFFVGFFAVPLLVAQGTSADSAAALVPPGFVPSTHPIAFFWATAVAALGSLISEGGQRFSAWFDRQGAWTKRVLTAGLTYGLGLLFGVAGVNLPVNLLSLQGAGAFVLAGGLMSFGTHQVLFSSKS